MFKRFFLFAAVNILIVVTISIVTRLLGLEPYMTANGINYESLAVFCLIWGMGGSFISLMISKWMAKTMMGVQIVDKNGQYGELVQTVHMLARKAKLDKMPDVGIYQAPEINAFATGPTRNNSLVAVSTGLLERMNRDELEGVLGHEVAHIANGDMVTMTLVQGVINAFVMFFARIVAYAISQALRSDDEEGGSSGGLGMFAHMMVVFVLEILFGILGSIVVAAFSRYREYRADAGGSKLAGKEKMLGALKALQSNYETLMQTKESSGAIKSMQISSKHSWLALFSSHPPLEDRIKALERGRH